MKIHPVSRTNTGTLLRRSFQGLVGLLIGSAVLVYALSPRRDPTFVPTSSNAGMFAIPESTWIWGLGVLAVALAINFVLLLFTTPYAQRMLRQPGPFVILTRLVAAAAGVLVGAGLAAILALSMLWYLLSQSIID